MTEPGWFEVNGRKVQVWIPKRRFLTLPEGCEAIGLCGYRYTRAVMGNGECLGWIELKAA